MRGLSLDCHLPGNRLSLDAEELCHLLGNGLSLDAEEL